MGVVGCPVTTAAPPGELTGRPAAAGPRGPGESRRPGRRAPRRSCSSSGESWNVVHGTPSRHCSARNQEERGKAPGRPAVASPHRAARQAGGEVLRCADFVANISKPWKGLIADEVTSELASTLTGVEATAP